MGAPKKDDGLEAAAPEAEVEAAAPVAADPNPVGTGVSPEYFRPMPED